MDQKMMGRKSKIADAAGDLAWGAWVGVSNAVRL